MTLAKKQESFFVCCTFVADAGVVYMCKVLYFINLKNKV